MCKIGLLEPYRGYMSEIHYSYSDNIYYGELLGTSDSISFHADSVIKLYERFKEVVDDYIELKETTL